MLALFLDSKLLYAWQGASLTWSIIKEAIMLGLQLDNCESISAINSHESHEFQIKSQHRRAANAYYQPIFLAMLIVCKLLYLCSLHVILEWHLSS